MFIKVGDNITTDHIMPAGAKYCHFVLIFLQYHNTVLQYVMRSSKEALEFGKSIIVGGSNYGQGSSREHAALAPLYLGVKAVLVKSFARIHRANLINAGIVPLIFKNEADYDNISLNDDLVLADIKSKLESGVGEFTFLNKTNGKEIPVLCEVSNRERDIILAGGLLNYTKMQLD